MTQEMTPVVIMSAAQKGAVASALTAMVAMQQSALAAHGHRRKLRPVSSGIFGTPVYDRDANIPQQATTPRVVQPGQSAIGPAVTQGAGPDVDMHPARIQVGGKRAIGQRGPEGQTVFSGPRMFTGMYGSSIFGGGISGLGAMRQGDGGGGGGGGGAVVSRPIVAPQIQRSSRYRRGGRISGLGDFDAHGFVMAPNRSDDPKHRCGFLGRMIDWDGGWPCNNATYNSALQAQIAWWAANPANKAADSASRATPAGIPPYGKTAWITAMCSGMAPIPPGLTMPSVCGLTSGGAPPPAPGGPAMQPMMIGGSRLVGGGTQTLPAVTGGGMSSKTMLIAGGLAVAAAATFFFLKGKKTGTTAAPAAAA